MNPLALQLNQTIKKESSAVYDLLSDSGRKLFFPVKGILAQATEAKGQKTNATIGIALDDNGIPLHLESLSGLINMPPKDIFPYATSAGRPDLRKKWSEMIIRKNPLLQEKTMSLPVVTCALSHGISVVARMFLDRGDTLIIPDMYWGNYNLLIKETYDANFDSYPFYDGQHMNLQGMKQRLLNPHDIGKKILCLNFPNNPTGYTPVKEEAAEIAAICRQSADMGNKIVVICDDAYFGLVYEDNVEKQSLFAYLADSHENILAIKVDGATKEDYVWGFRVGFITYSVKGGSDAVYRALEQKTSGAIRASISSAPNLSQSLLLKAYESGTYLEEKQRAYNLLKARYDEVKKVLHENEERYSIFFKALPYNSGYFMCVRLADNIDGDRLRRHLIEKYNTGTIYIRGVLRLAFSCVAKDRIAKMFENIYKACRDLT